MKKYYRVEIVYTGILDMISSNTFTDYQAEKPETTTEHSPMKDVHKAWFENPVEAEKYRQQTVSMMIRRTCQCYGSQYMTASRVWT